MEAADPFAQTATAEDDPFKEADGADLEPTTAGEAADEVAAEPAAEEPPIVNREGERVDGAEEPQAAAEAPTAPPQPQEAGGGEQPPQEPPAPPATDEPDADAAAPANPAPESGKKVETRLYKLLYQTGKAQWTEADLTGVPDEVKPYVASDEGELFLKARNNDHARRLAFAALGQPEAGVTVELVARTGWKPKRLSVAPPEPTKTRLVVS